MADATKLTVVNADDKIREVAAKYHKNYKELEGLNATYQQLAKDIQAIKAEQLRHMVELKGLMSPVAGRNQTYIFDNVALVWLGNNFYVTTVCGRGA